MTLPQTNHIYLYKGKKYIVRYAAILDRNLVAQTIPENNEGLEFNSNFETFNYWNFLLNAKHIDEIKLGKSY